jgi:UDP-glucose 4-epimerase
MQARKSLVTGGAGFIGSHLVDHLMSRGDEVTIVDNFRTGRHEFINCEAELVNCDIDNTKVLTRYFENVDDVYHLAANADVRNGWDDPSRDFEFNLARTLSVAELSAAAGVENFIFSSTGSIYGEATIVPTPEDYAIVQQTSLYGASKYSCESFLGAYAEANKFKVTILRFVSVLGPRYTHGHVYDFIKKLLLDPSSLNVLGDGTQNKSYMHVSDCVEAITDLRGSKNFEVFNVGSAETLKVRRSIEIISEVLNVFPELSFGESSRGWIGDNPIILLDTTKANSIGWKPKIGIEDAVRDTANWIIQNPWVLDNE